MDSPPLGDDWLNKQPLSFQSYCDNEAAVLNLVALS